MKTITHTEDHRPLRAAAYPSVGDQLEAMWQILEQLAPTETAAHPVYRQIHLVKATYPKEKS